MTERKAYLICRDEMDHIENLIGPIRGGMEQAAALRDQMLVVDQMLADAVDWEDSTVSGLPFYSSLQVIDLDEAEIAVMTDMAGATDD